MSTLMLTCAKLRPRNQHLVSTRIEDREKLSYLKSDFGVYVKGVVASAGIPPHL